MTLTDLLTSCAIDTAAIGVRPHSCVLWVLRHTPHGAHATRIAFASRGARSVALEQWVDILATAMRADPMWLPGRGLLSAASGFRPVLAAPATAPTALAVLLPGPGGPVLEAACETGDAVEAPWLPDPANAGIGGRTLPRKWSIAAALLDLARQVARARMN
jgi:hypothetical protein